MTTRTSIIIAALLLLTFPTIIAAQAGAPLLTQSPGTPKQGHWAHKLSVNLDDRGTKEVWKIPQLDVTYGLTNRIQVQAKLPWMLSHTPGQDDKTGLGNSLLAAKWRFAENTSSGWAMSVYPQLEFNNPTKSVERGLASDGWQLLMPLQVAARTGPVRFAADLGYRIGEVSRDAYSYGIAGNVKPAKWLELLAEFHDVASRRFVDRDPIIAGGTRIKMTGRTLLLTSYGHRVGGHLAHGRGAVAYFGLQTDM